MRARQRHRPLEQRRGVGQHRVDQADRERALGAEPLAGVGHLARHALRHDLRQALQARRGRRPCRSLISWTVKNASALQRRMSHAVARSSAPPMQPPWIAQIDREARFVEGAEAVHQLAQRLLEGEALARRRRAPAPRRRRRRRRAPCRPRSACRSTRSPARASSPASPRRRTASRSAGKNAGVIVFSRSGRFSCRWATPFSCESSKNSLSWSVHGVREDERWTTSTIRDPRRPDLARAATGRPPTPRGTIVIVHGLGEHIGRYAHVAAHLNAQRLERRRLRPARPRRERRRARPARAPTTTCCVDLAARRSTPFAPSIRRPAGAARPQPRRPGRGALRRRRRSRRRGRPGSATVDALCCRRRRSTSA